MGQCVLSSPIQGSNPHGTDWRFHIDPNRVSWDFEVSYVDWPTVGGKVVQILGTQLGDMTVEGVFETWQQQAEFLKWVKHATRDQAKFAERAPFRFLYAPKNWDFQVAIKDFKEGSRSVRWDVGTIVPTFRLILLPIEDNTGIVEVAKDAYIERVAREFGWEVTPYNGPVSWAEVEETISGAGASSVSEYIQMHAGGLPTGTYDQSNFPPAADIGGGSNSDGAPVAAGGGGGVVQ